MDAEPCIWPGSVVAPDPQRLEEAARFLASQARPDDVLFSLSETGLLACARAAELVPGLRGLRVPAAVRCVDRRALRRTLDPAGEGQRWAVDEAPRASGPYVVKAAASAASNGVRIVEDAGSIACAAREAWACARPELEPRNAETLLAASALLARLGDSERAIVNAERAVALPGAFLNPGARERLAELARVLDERRGVAPHTADAASRAKALARKAKLE